MVNLGGFISHLKGFSLITKSRMNKGTVRHT